MIQSNRKIRTRQTSRLQHELMVSIVQLVHEDGLAIGDRLNEVHLARRLNVSRTPVRAAIEQLVAEGYVAREPNMGPHLLAIPPLPEPDEGNGEPLDDLLMRIAADRRAAILQPEISETELMRIYGLSRRTVRHALERLSGLDVIERKPGYGWKFINQPQDKVAHGESYRYRMVIEIAAITDPDYTLDPAWAADIRKRHEAFLAAPADQFSSVDFFEMNAAFHEGVCAGSGNRFFLDGIRRQNQLRRLSNYDWRYGAERVAVNSREHLAILDRLELGDREIAAILMRRHLEGAQALRRP